MGVNNPDKEKALQQKLKGEINRVTTLHSRYAHAHRLTGY